jgi:hypothetical protein
MRPFGLPRTLLHEAYQKRQPAALVGASEALHLRRDRLLGLGDQHAAGQGGHVEDENSRAEREQDEIQRRKPGRGRLHDRREGGHQPADFSM